MRRIGDLLSSDGTSVPDVSKARQVTAAMAQDRLARAVAFSISAAVGNARPNLAAVTAV